jgi:general L-amino acid transport system permease protein
MSWRNRSRTFLYQAVPAAALLLGGVWLVALFTENLQKGAGFGVLWRPSNFNFGETLIPTGPSDTYGRSLLTAFTNTLWVSLNACILATVLGIAVAIASRSRLVLLRRIVSTYVEVFRNTPLLLQLLLWYTLVQGLPPVRDAFAIGEVFISQRGIALPRIDLSLPGLVLVGMTLVMWMAISRLPSVRSLHLIRLLLGSAALVIIAGAVLTGASVQNPELTGFNFRGGWRLSPEFLAMLVGITLYSAAFISEIVRSGIDAVSKGQWEASAALGLGRLHCMRLVILPQATRVAIPPLVSEYAGIVKNSSLAVALGYPDLVWASNTAISQTGQAVEIILVVMVLYLSVSTLISLGLNLFNRRMMTRYG